jgi:hypothetical protein
LDQGLGLIVKNREAGALNQSGGDNLSLAVQGKRHGDHALDIVSSGRGGVFAKTDNLASYLIFIRGKGVGYPSSCATTKTPLAGALAPASSGSLTSTRTDSGLSPLGAFLGTIAIGWPRGRGFWFGLRLRLWCFLWGWGRGQRDFLGLRGETLYDRQILGFYNIRLQYEFRLGFRDYVWNWFFL